MICGIDEVGRGCLAGDVLACAVVFHGDAPEGLADSKKISASRRSDLDARIREVAYVSIGRASVREIERINILQATMLAMRRSFEGLPPLDLKEIRVDGNRIPVLNTPRPIRCIIGGDAIEAAISAASICAKVARDAEMDELHLQHPHYDWSSNRGYGSPKHLAALAERGPTIHHRMTFAPLRQPTLDL